MEEANLSFNFLIQIFYHTRPDFFVSLLKPKQSMEQEDTKANSLNKTGMFHIRGSENGSQMQHVGRCVAPFLFV